MMPRVSAVSAGGEHSAFVCENGELLMCGNHENGRLGIGQTENDVSLPVPCLIPTCAVSLVCCGEFHTVFAAADGRVFAFGCGSLGQLGQRCFDDQWLPVEIEYFRGKSPPISFACGDSHTVVVLMDGSVHCFGSSVMHAQGLLESMSGCVKQSERYGFGVRESRNRLPPSAILGFSEKIVQCATGSRHSLFLDVKGNTYALGDNTKGQLGLGPGVMKTSVPRVLPLQGIATKVACGSLHSFVLLQDRTVFGFGNNLNGELGLSKEVQVANVPKQLSIPPVRELSCGAVHSFFVTVAGDLLSCGWPSCGRLGYAAGADVQVPQLCPPSWKKTLEVVSVSCGWHHTLVLLSDGVVFSVGCGGRGQLGSGNIDSASFLPVLRRGAPCLCHAEAAKQRSATATSAFNSPPRNPREGESNADEISFEPYRFTPIDGE